MRRGNQRQPGLAPYDPRQHQRCRAGYDGWYVLEQDTILSGPPEGEGPVEDVRTSYDFLLALSAQHSGVGI